MNYYAFHIGDYVAHTMHLEPMEDLAYRRLLDQYYLREGPLPVDTEATAKLVRMRSHKADVESVLKEFFVLTDDGWTHGRCESEVTHAQEKRTKARDAGLKSSALRQRKPDDVGNVRSTDVQRTLPPEPTDVGVSGNGRATPNPNPNPNPNKEKEHPSDASSALPPPAPPPDKQKVLTKKPRGSRAPASIADMPDWVQRLLDTYHEILPELEAVQVVTKERREAMFGFRDWVLALRQKGSSEPRVKTDDQFIEWSRKFFEKARENDFVMGRVPKSKDHPNWRAGIAYLLSDRGVAQVFERTDGGAK